MRKSIAFLVRDRQQKKVKLVMLYIHPWKDIEFSEPFDVPENFFFAKRDVAQIKSGEQEPKFQYTDDKIKRIFLLPTKKEKAATLII